MVLISSQLGSRLWERCAGGLLQCPRYQHPGGRSGAESAENHDTVTTKVSTSPAGALELDGLSDPPPKLGPEVNSIIPHIRQSLVWRRDNWTSQPSSAFLKIVARDLSSWGSLTTNAPRSWETRASILKGLGSGEPCKIHYISSVFFSHGNHSGYFLLLNCIWLFPPLSQVVIWYQKNHLSFWGQKEYNLFGILGTKICCRLTSICQLWWYCMELAQVSCAMGLCRIRSQQTAQKHIGLPQSCCLSMPSHPNLLWIFPIKFQRYHRKEKLILLRVYVPHLSDG